MRISGNPTTLRLLQNLQQNSDELQDVQETISSGKRLRDSEDDPSDFALTQRLQTQARSVAQASQNVQSGQNLLNTADSSLQEVSNLLNDIRSSLTFALNEGGVSDDELQAEQEAINNAVESINRIAKSTRFNGKELLNGNQEIETLSTTGSAINNLNIQEINLPNGRPDRRIEFDMLKSATRGRVQLGSVPGEATIRVTGSRGTREVEVQSAGPSQVAKAINNVAGKTGVFTSSPGASTLALSEEFGSDEAVKLEVVEGTAELNGATRSEGFNVDANGQDPVIEINGLEFTGDGRSFDVVSNFGNFQFDLDPGNSTAAITPGQFPDQEQRFKVDNSGMNFQVGGEFQEADQLRIGIRSVRTSVMGKDKVQDPIGRVLGNSNAKKGGVLSSLKSGQGNDVFQNPENALDIVNQVENRLGSIRNFLGTTSGKFFESQRTTLDRLEDETNTTKSDLEDANIAEQASEQARLQTQRQAGISVLAQSRQIQQSVIQNLL